MAEISIKAPREGISASPHTGYADIRNCDISSVPGIARLNNILAKKSGATVDAQVKWFARDPDTSANIFALDSVGTLYKSADSGVTWAEPANSTRGGAGQGLIVRWGYVFVFCDTTIDVMKISDSTWTDDWQTIGTDSLWHPAFVSKNDGKIYFGCGRYVGSIEQLSTFVPGTPATYTVTLGTSANNALDLPSAYRIKCIEELGNDLRMGTWQGTNVYDVREAVMFSWDRSSVSFGQPVVIPEYGVHAMKNVGNSLIVLAGTTGTIYRSDGVNATIIGKLPIDLSGGKYIEYYPGSLTYYKNKIFFGIGHTALTVGGVATTIAGMGVYSLETTSKGNILNLEHLPSTLTDGSAASVKCTALLPISDETLLVGWATSGVVTMTIADPCVVTLASHGFIDGTAILFTTTGALPTGITASTYYYIRSTGTNTFNLYDTAAHAIAGGATGRVATTGTQSGVHTMASYGIDLTTEASFAYGTDYSGYFESPLYNVGSLLRQVTPTEIEFNLARPLRTDEAVRLAYRTDLTASYTTIATHTFATAGAVVSVNTVYDFPPCEQIQFRVSLKGTATTSPELKNISIRW